MKRVTLLLSICLAGLTLSARAAAQNIASLSSGNISDGIFPEIKDSRVLSTGLPDSDTFNNDSKSPESIKKKPAEKDEGAVRNIEFLESGYQGIIEMGLSAALPPDNFTALLKLSAVNGYRFNRHLFLGAGTGLRYPYSTANEYRINGVNSPCFNDIGVPVFLDIRTNIIIKKVVTYAGLAAGYSFDMKNNDPLTRGKKYYLNHVAGVGPFFTVSLGVNLSASRRNTVNLGFSYELQKVNPYGRYVFGYEDPSTVSISNCVSFNLGIGF
jgi:hypothetical protein